MKQQTLFELDNCIKCSICVTNCPVTKVTEKFAGPKQNGPDLERFRLEDSAAVHPSISYCLGCKNCDIACPSGVAVSAMNTRAKGEYVKLNGAPLRDKLLSRVSLMAKAAGLAPGAVNFFAGIKPLRAAAEKVMGISADITLPRYASKTFYQLYKKKIPAAGKEKVIYYPGCYTTYNTPEVGMALVNVLAHNGVEVLVDKSFKCCGLPLMANGLLDAAEKNARNNLTIIKEYINKGYKIITSCPSCNLTLRQEYHEVLGLETGDLNNDILDVFEYLQILAEKGKLRTDLRQIKKVMGYHQPCHLKAAGTGTPSLDILNNLIPGLKVIDLNAGCCGISGSYGFKKEKYAISQQIGQQVFDAVKKNNFKEVLSECGTCQLQIKHGTGAAVYHPIQVLAESYSLGEYLQKKKQP